MTTSREITAMRAQLRRAMENLAEAENSINGARETMRDANALIDAMADELADFRGEA